MIGSKSQKYALYAIGELLLVVVGILIALQVNNWNEQRIEQRQIRQYAIGLVADLRRDLAMIEPIREQIEDTVEKSIALNSYVRGKSLEQLDNFSLWFLAPSLAYRPYEWNRTAIEQMRNAGAFREIDQTLAKKITGYEALTRHLDEDYHNDMARIVNAANFADHVIDAGYSDVFDDYDFYKEISDKPVMERLEIWHARYQGPELSLLTNDLKDIKILVNKYDKLLSLQPRTRSEIPRLTKMAEELIELLTAEYQIESPAAELE